MGYATAASWIMVTTLHYVQIPFHTKQKLKLGNVNYVK